MPPPYDKLQEIESQIKGLEGFRRIQYKSTMAAIIINGAEDPQPFFDILKERDIKRFEDCLGKQKCKIPECKHIKVNSLIRKMGFSRYFSRTFYKEYKKVANFIVGLDYNPYSPYAVRDLIDFEFLEFGISYSKIWKDATIIGYYSARAKRYYSDSWYNEIFSATAPYNKALMSLDIVVNSFHFFESFFF